LRHLKISRAVEFIGQQSVLGKKIYVRSSGSWCAIANLRLELAKGSSSPILQRIRRLSIARN
jgi:hypothetical protein